MAAASSAPFFGMREEDHNMMIKQQQQQQQQQQSNSSTIPPSSSTAPPQSAAPAKKKRNLPGTPNPDAEVIALSPKTLMATNRFICEVCNKGFQREQNLQLHRRGHNLPWKLKQKSTKEVRRKVYLCPEPSCVHHEPSRALGDLTGIKKHFSRKHGEKKWKCDKCSKRYAVKSDWKAHSKTCGTREYRCDCGTLFSRRDSFITHRAFCDALAQESARLPTGLASLGSHLYGGNMGLGLSQMNNSQMSSLHNHQQTHPSADLLRLGAAGGGPQFDHLLPPSSSSFRQPPSAFYLGGSGGPNHHQDFSSNDDDTQSHHSLLQSTKPPFGAGLMQLPQDLQTNASHPSSSAAAAANLFNLSFFPNGSTTSSMNNNNNYNSSQNSHLQLIPDQFSNAGGNNNEQAACTLFSGSLMNDHQLASGVSSLYSTSMQSNHHDSVGGLPQMSATALLQKAAQMGATTSGGAGSSSLLRGFGSSSSMTGAKPTTSFRTQVENEAHIHDLMNSLANGSAGIFGGPEQENVRFGGFNADGSIGGMDAEARFRHSMSSVGSNIGASDGLTRDFLGVGSMVRGMGGEQHHHHHNIGIGIGTSEPELKSASGGRSSTGGSLQ
ncbi:uncharacterized protein M6B38_206290 [Iris pallida]|uniref:Protein EARLY HEADING DATE 2 n=1 Tax=Iris pallida TaxID=29817 RepID=A0AAX6E692_IRIPA|nr:uncharacterized protein M6B38_206290 [Iris pallida]